MLIRGIAMKGRVVVTGMGLITPVGNSISSFWESISNGKSGVDYINSFDTKGLPTTIGAEVKGFCAKDYFSRKEINRIDVFTQYAIVSAMQAIEHSQLNIKDINPYRVGVIVGSGSGGTNMLLENHKKILERGPRRVSPFLAAGMLINSSSSEIARRIGSKGRSGAFVSACATSSDCIGLAYRSIQYGEADIVIAGGTEGPFSLIDLMSFSNIRALSRRNDNPEGASRPFDKNRDGFVLGAGGGVVVMESYESCKRRGGEVLAEIIGYGVTTDTYHSTAPNPTGESLVQAINIALEDANLSLDQIDHINAHGTSTKYNDYTETMALKEVFDTHAKDIPVNSIKSMTGHLLAGAGVVELIASILTIKHQLIPPTINYHTVDENMDLNYVPNTAQRHAVRTVLNNSIGFGGHNSCIVVKEWNE